MLQTDVFAVLFINELKNLTNVVIVNCSHDFLFYFINYSIIIVQVRYITIETKEVAHIEYNGFPFPHDSYSLGEGIGARHLSSHAEKETRFIQY
jgi:hypothetical protein